MVMLTYDTANNLTDLQLFDGGCGEENSNKASDQHQTANDSITISKLLRDDSIDHEANNLTYDSAIGETGLPGSSDLILAAVELFTELLIELRDGI